MGRTVIITGATRGLGLVLACRFLKAGDRVYGVSRTKKAWKSAFSHFPGTGKATLHQIDLTSEKAVRAFAAAVRRESKNVDVLINNAGYGGSLSPIESLSVKEYEKLWQHNLTSAFLMCKHFLPVFQKQKSGYILNISSMAGKRAVPRIFGYSAAKFGIVALTQAMAKENEQGGFKCLTVCPGGMHTEMRASLFGKKDAARQQSPEFVAGIILNVVEERLPLLSGSDIVIRHGRVWAVNPPPAA